LSNNKAILQTLAGGALTPLFIHDPIYAKRRWGCALKIIIDTREQKPLKFNNEQISEIVSQKLDFGDYACVFEDGHMPAVYFERKSISDLFGTMGVGYKRFKKEIIRAQEAKADMFIIVEGSLTQVRKGYKHSKMKGISMVRKLYTLWVRYGIMPIFCIDANEAAEYITQFYIGCGREYVRGWSEKK